MENKFTSRKFLLAIGAVVSAVGAALSGSIGWDMAIKAILVAVGAYQVAEGAKDVVGAYRHDTLELPHEDYEEPKANDYDLESARRVFERFHMDFTADNLRRLSSVGPDAVAVLTDLEIVASFKELNRLSHLTP